MDEHADQCAEEGGCVGVFAVAPGGEGEDYVDGEERYEADDSCGCEDCEEAGV